MCEYLRVGAGLAAGADQVGGVAQVDEHLLLREQRRNGEIQEEKLRRETRSELSGQTRRSVNSQTLIGCHTKGRNKYRYR